MRGRPFGPGMSSNERRSLAAEKDDERTSRDNKADCLFTKPDHLHRTNIFTNFERMLAHGKLIKYELKTFRFLQGKECELQGNRESHKSPDPTAEGEVNHSLTPIEFEFCS